MISSKTSSVLNLREIFKYRFLMDEKGVIGDCSHDFSEIFGALAGSKVGDTFVLLDHEMDFAQMLKQQSLVKMQDCALGITLKGRFTPMRDQYLFVGHLVLPDHLYDWVEQPSSFDNEFTPNINAYFQTFDEDEPYVFEGQNVRASEILSISKFPSENPNPVYRVSCKGKLLYANDACLQLLCRPVASQFKLHEKLIAVHQENVERRTGNDQRILLNERVYAVQSVLVPKEKYINYYVKDISAEVAFQKASKTEFNRLTTLVTSLYGAVILEDDLGTMVLSNDNLVTVLGVDKKHASKKNKKDLFSEAEFELLFTKTFSKEQFSSDEIMFNQKVLRREYVPILCDGNYQGCLWKFNDISSEKNREQELLEAKDLAERSLKYKAEFLANMSHEIRTPMNGVLGMSKLLLKENLTAQQREYLDNISSCSNHLLTIINDILDLSKIESGKLQLETIPFDVQEVCDKAMNNVSVMLLDKPEVTLQAIIPDQLHALVVKGDPVRLNQILTNLLSNAIKFTAKGKVELKVIVELDTAEEINLNFQVIDSGIGMSKEQLGLIFKSFEQADCSISRKFGGTGLGLSICKSLVNMQKGIIRAESTSGIGSVFTVNLTYKKSLQTLEKREPEQREDTCIKGVSILVVEDNLVNQLYTRKIIEDKEGLVDIVSNGVEAIDMLKHQSYDIILMDIQMPVMGGFEATQIIREELKLKIPIIALTANAMSGEKEKCLENGMSSYISKPFPAEELFRRVKELVCPERQKQSQ